MSAIEKSGVYDIPIEEYHADCCVGPSISSSGLRTILMESPAHFWAYSYLNPAPFPDESTKALDYGRAAHCLVLGEPEFNRYFIVSPYDDFRKKEAQEWRDAQTRTVLKAKEFDTIQAIAAVRRRSHQCMNAFTNGKPEQSLIWQDEETGIWLKTRPDWLPDDPKANFICEYKSAVTIEPRKWASAAFGYGYAIQAALQIDGVRNVLGIKNPLGVAHIVQEKAPPYLAEVRMFGPEQIEDGRFMYRRALRIFAQCLKTGEWPGYTSEPQFVETPYWFAQLMETMKNGIDRSGSTPERTDAELADILAAI